MADKTGYVGRNPADSSVIISRQLFEPTGVQTDFTFASGYTVGYLDMYLNGVRQTEGKTFNANDGVTVSFASTFAISGDLVEIIAYKAFNLQNTINSTVADFTVGNNVLVGNDARISNDLNVTGIGTVGEGFNVSAGGANISGVVTATSYKGDGSALTGIAATDTIAAASLTVSGISTFTGVVKGLSDVRVTGNLNAGITTLGAVTVTSITGDGSGLTGVANTDVVHTREITASGVSTFSGNVNLSGANITLQDSGGASDDRLVLGAGSDLSLYHDGSSSFIKDTAGSTFNIQATESIAIKTNDTEFAIACNKNGAVELYNDSIKQFETNAHGIEVAHAGTASTSRFLAGGSVGVGIGVTTTTGRDAAAGIGTVKGQIVYNETTDAVQVYNGTAWQNIFTQPFTASGGTEITDGDNKYHVFTSPGTFQVLTGDKSRFDVLVIGGGGGGAGNNSGGGGAGGLVYIPQPVFFPIEGSVPVSVGGGGEGRPDNSQNAGNGSNSTLGSLLTAIGGGGSTAWTNPAPTPSQNGGSAAGGSGTPTSNPSAFRGAGTATQPTQPGNSGTYGHGSGAGSGGRTSGDTSGAGGGGAGGSSTSVPSPGSEPANIGTDGGAGYSVPAFPGPVIAPAIPGPVRPGWTPVVGPSGTFAGGGGGGAGGSPHPGNMAEGGSGGGGRGGSAQGSIAGNPGVEFTGSGGGGGDNTTGGDGATGIVIIKYDTTTTGAD